MKESLYKYSSSAVVEVRNCIPVASFTDERELEMKVLLKAALIVFLSVK